jgi:hypothetical protein
VSKLNIAGLYKYLIQHGNTQTNITNTSTNKIFLMGRKQLIDLTWNGSVENGPYSGARNTLPNRDSSVRVHECIHHLLCFL